MATINLPSSTRRPVAAQSFDFTSQARGLVPVARRLAIVAAMTSAGSATAAEPVQVTSEADARTLFGTGSECALMVAAANKAFRKVQRQHGGGPAEIWVSPVADAGGTAAVHRFAISGTSTEQADIVVRICGRTVRAGIASGVAAAAAATALDEAVDAIANDLPVTSAVATSVNVDLTARQTGVNGDDIVISVESAPAGLTITPSQTVSGAGAPTLTTSLASLLDKQYLAIAIADHTSTEVTALTTHLTNAWDSIEKKFGHGFVGETGTLSTATTLASGANDETAVIVAGESFRDLPYEIAAQVAAMSVVVEKPSYNYNRTELDLYGPPIASAFNATEIETALAGGATPLSLTENGDVLMERLVTTKTTVNSAPFEDLLDLKNSKTLAHYALQIDAMALAAMQGANLDDDFIGLIEDRAINILELGEEAGDLQNVEDHLDDLILEVHPTIKSRLLVEIPQSVVQSANQIDFTHRMFIEAPAGG